jgi:hypothetical protein
MTSIPDTATMMTQTEWSPQSDSDARSSHLDAARLRGTDAPRSGPEKFGQLLQGPSSRTVKDTSTTMTAATAPAAENDRPIEDILPALSLALDIPIGNLRHLSGLDGCVGSLPDPTSNTEPAETTDRLPGLDAVTADAAAGPGSPPPLHDNGAHTPVAIRSDGRGARIPALEFGLTHATPAALFNLGLAAGGNTSTAGPDAIRKLKGAFGRGKGNAPQGILAGKINELQVRRTEGSGALDVARPVNSSAVAAGTGSTAAHGRDEPQPSDAALPARLRELTELRDRVRSSMGDLGATQQASAVPSGKAWAANRDAQVGVRSKIVADIEPALAEVAHLVRDHERQGRPEVGELRTLQRELTHLAVAAEFGVDAEAATHALVAVQSKLGTSPLPLGATLRAMGSAVPSLRDWATSPDPAKQHAAATSLATLASMLEDGEHLDFVLGHDASLNKAFLPLRQAHAERNAVATLSTRHEVEGRDPPTEQEKDAVRGSARDAAALRLELSSANRQLERLLTTDRRDWRQPSTWGETGPALGDGSASVLRKDPAFINALRKRGGAKAGRDVALLVARISDLERRTLSLEKNMLGLHSRLDPDHLGSPDPEHPLAHVGITNDDLAAMGLDSIAREQLIPRAIALNDQGLANVQDVVTTNKAVHDVAHSVFRNTLSQEAVATFARQQPAMRQRLLGELLAGAANAPSAGTRNPMATDPNVMAHFRTQAAAARTMMLGNSGGTSRWDGLRDSAARYRDAEAEVTTQMGVLHDIDRQQDRARRNLAIDPGQGRTLDPSKPEGLQSAKAILQALDANEALLRDGSDAQAMTSRDAALEKLRGFDTARMHRPWHQKAAARLGLSERPDMSELAALRPRAEAIVLLRETAPRAKAAAQVKIEQQGAVMDQILTQRHDDNPAVAQWARQTIRAAVLASWPNDAPDRTITDGVAASGFDPAANRDKIEGLLSQWGLDTSRFAPEIDQVLYGAIGPAELAAWRKEAAIPLSSAPPGSATSDPATPGLGSRAAEVPLHRQTMDGESTGALRSIIEGMRSGDSLNLKTGQRVTLDSSKLPVEPSGLLGLRARLAAANVAECEIERGSSDYKIHLRTGGEGKANLDLIAGQAFGHFGKFEAGTGAEGSHARNAGVTLVFGNDDKGREALLALVDKMARGEDIGVTDWVDAKAVARGRVSTSKAALNIRANVRGEFTAAPTPAVNKQGVGLSLEATATASGSLKSTEIKNLTERTSKGSAEVSVGIRANASFYAQLYNAANAATGLPLRGGPQAQVTEHFGTQNAKPGGSPNFNISNGTANTDLLGASLGTTATCTRKWKQVTDRDDHITKAEVVRQTNVRSGAVSAMSTVATEEMRRRIQDNPEFGRNVGAMLQLMGNDDVLSITYDIKPHQLRHANALFDEATALRRHGEPERAAALKKRAQAIVEDDASYQPSKISLLTTAADKRQATNLNMRFLRWDTYAEGKTEHPVVEMEVP